MGHPSRRWPHLIHMKIDDQLAVIEDVMFVQQLQLTVVHPTEVPTNNRTTFLSFDSFILWFFCKVATAQWASC
jgi:hypothetical protein